MVKAIYGVPGDAAADPRRKGQAVQSLFDAGETIFAVARAWPRGDDPAFGVVKTLTVEYTVDGKPHKASGEDPETIDLVPEAIADAKRPATLTGAADGERGAGSLAERPLRVHHGVRPQAGRHGRRIFRPPRPWRVRGN